MKQVTIHSDGSCHPNPGPGGWAAVLQFGETRLELSGRALDTTNNRMEMQAAIEALRALKEPCKVTLYTDSQYLRQGITLWVRGWKFNGWKTKEKQPVKNCDLWIELDALSAKHQVDWKWVRGHNGDPLNERCDVLATWQTRVLRKKTKNGSLTKDDLAKIHVSRSSIPFFSCTPE